MRSWLRALGAIVVSILAGSASAQQPDAGGSLRWGLLTVEGLQVGTTLTVDQAFAAKHGVAVPSPFSVFVPTADDVLELVDHAPQGPGGAFFKLNFATDDRQLIENIQLVPLSLPLAEPGQRLDALARLLAGNAFATATAGYPENSRDIVRATTIDGRDAVEVIGRYRDPALGLMYLRIVGIPHPERAEGVFAVANVVAGRLELASPDDFPRTRGGAMLDRFRYLEP